MDSRADLREFLATRRAKVTPQQAGLPNHGGHRRVPGLRREEVALLAGVSVDYYTRLERGNAKGVSESVLEGLARALQLDDAERAHLHDLVRAGNATAPTRRRSPRPMVRPGVQQLLDAIGSVPAFVQNGRLDVLAANPLARALYSPLYDSATTTRLPNHARFTFLDPAAVDFYPRWDRAAADTVALLRVEAGRSPDDRVLNELVGELSTKNERFAALWATHNVRWHTTGTKTFRHPVAGDVDLDYEGLELTGDPGQTLITFTAAPNSLAGEALSFLSSWAARAAPSEPGSERSVP